MFTYKLDKVTKMGDMDAKYGQSYWAESSSELKPLKFNSMNENIKVGDTITAEESANRRSGKGTDYLQLRKVKVEGAQTAPQGSSQLDRIEKKLDKLISTLNGQDTVHEGLDGEPISLDDIPL